MKKVNKKSKTKSLPNWTLGTCAAISAVLGVYFTDISTEQLPDTGKFVNENIGTGFLILFIVLSLVLTVKQKYLYWPFFSRTDYKNADERQLRVRERVFEKSYRALFIVVVLAVTLTNIKDSRMQTFLWFTLVAAFFATPAITATRQKDS